MHSLSSTLTLTLILTLECEYKPRSEYRKQITGQMNTIEKLQQKNESLRYVTCHHFLYSNSNPDCYPDCNSNSNSRDRNKALEDQHIRDKNTINNLKKKLQVF
jgi:hypothetical protein